MDTLLHLTIDSHGTIKNPVLQPDQQSRKKWGAYMCRRGDNVQPVRDAFLLRDDGARLDVSRVPAGVCLGFGAEIQQPDGQWEKIRQLHLVEHRSATSITLRRVDEWEVPGHPELACDPTLAYLLDELARTREHVKKLESAVQSLIPHPTEPL